MTLRALLDRLTRDVLRELSAGDSAVSRAEAERIARAIVARYGVAGAARQEIGAEAITQARAIARRLSTPEEQRLFAEVAQRTTAELSRIQGSAERRIARAVGRAFGRAGGVDERELLQALRPAVRGIRADAGTIARTAAGAYDRAARLVDAEGAAEDGVVMRYRYAGPPADREFCRRLLKEAQGGKTYTLAEIRRLSNGQGLPVELYCGGYNCRHQWLPVVTG